MNYGAPENPRPPSKKVKETIRQRYRKQIPWEDACKLTGMSPSGIHKARLSPRTQAFEAEERDRYLKEVEELRAPLKARALEVARDLLENADSEIVRARMVEFLRAESKKDAPAVAVQINNMASTGYEFIPPGHTVVEVRPAAGENVVKTGSSEEKRHS